LERNIGIDLAAPAIARHAFDSESGALMVQLGEGLTPNFVSRFAIDSLYEPSRKYRAHVEFSGRVTTCAPTGSSVGAPSCPAL
jgi:hypothetical protein